GQFSELVCPLEEPNRSGMGNNQTKNKPNQKQKQENLPMLKIIALTITTAALAAFTTVHAQTEAAAAPPNDAQIAQIVLTADSVDVDYGNLAVKKTKN